MSIKLITCQNKLIADQKLIDYRGQNCPNTATNYSHLTFSSDLPLLREEFRLPEFILHSDLQCRAASRLALPRTSIYYYYYFYYYYYLALCLSLWHINVSIARPDVQLSWLISSMLSVCRARQCIQVTFPR